MWPDLHKEKRPQHRRHAEHLAQLRPGLGRLARLPLGNVSYVGKPEGDLNPARYLSLRLDLMIIWNADLPHRFQRPA